MIGPMPYRELRARLNNGIPDAAWRAAERLENVRSELAGAHNRLIDWRVAALSRGHGGSAEAFAIGARAVARALNVLLGEHPDGNAIAAAARQGGDVQQAPGETPQSGPKGSPQ